MAEAHKFKNLGEATAAFPDLPWQASAAGEVWIHNSKDDEYVPVAPGQFIYKVGDRFEVRDTEELPKTVKPATDKDVKAVEKALDAKEEPKKSDSDESDK